MFKRFNIWFDSIKEPKRFFVFLGIVAPGIFLTGLANFTGTSQFALLGFLYFCALLLIRVLGK